MRVLAVDLSFGSTFVATFDLRGVRILTVRLTIAVATITRVAVMHSSHRLANGQVYVYANGQVYVYAQCGFIVAIGVRDARYRIHTAS